MHCARLHLLKYAPTVAAELSSANTLLRMPARLSGGCVPVMPAQLVKQVAPAAVQELTTPATAAGWHEGGEAGSAAAVLLGQVLAGSWDTPALHLLTPQPERAGAASSSRRRAAGGGALTGDDEGVDVPPQHRDGDGGPRHAGALIGLLRRLKRVNPRGLGHHCASTGAGKQAGGSGRRGAA